MSHHAGSRPCTWPRCLQLCLARPRRVFSTLVAQRTPHTIGGYVPGTTPVREVEVLRVRSRPSIHPLTPHSSSPNSALPTRTSPLSSSLSPPLRTTHSSSPTSQAAACSRSSTSSTPDSLLLTPPTPSALIQLFDLAASTPTPHQNSSPPDARTITTTPARRTPGLEASSSLPSVSVGCRLGMHPPAKGSAGGWLVGIAREYVRVRAAAAGGIRGGVRVRGGWWAGCWFVIRCVVRPSGSSGRTSGCAGSPSRAGWSILSSGFDCVTRCYSYMFMVLCNSFCTCKFVCSLDIDGIKVVSGRGYREYRVNFGTGVCVDLMKW